MPDANSIKKMLMQHIMLFQTPIESIATDKGYYSKENEKIALDFGIKAVGIPKPIRKLKNAPDNPIFPKYLKLLENRRLGIEPLIGHLKKYWQMGRSRMKSDQTTESSALASILGFNLKQLMRYLTMEAKSLGS